MNRRRTSEHGMVLITVLGLMLTVSVLVASAVALSQYAAIEVNTFANFARTACIAEGAAQRVCWLLLADRQRYADRALGKIDYRELDEDRFLADGVIRELDYYDRNIKFTIQDAVAGVDLSGANPVGNLAYIGSALNAQQKTAEFNAFTEFCNRLLDYIDHDDLVRLNGMEKSDYEECGLYHLPRNRQLQFREEVLYIPGASDYFRPDSSGRLGAVRVIPPANLGRLGGRPNLYSTPLSQIAAFCRLSEAEMEHLDEAMKRWKHERIPLAESLAPELNAKITAVFSTGESGVYTIIVDTASVNAPGSTLAVTLRLNPGMRHIEYYEYTLY